MNILNEAFRSMSELDEDIFTLDKKGIEQMDDFINNDDDPFKKLSVIDPEAADEEDLEDSYEGKVILTCPVCHSDIFADPASLEIQDDAVTVHHECPYCHTTDEFEIKGQVVPFGGEAEEETKESEEETEDDGSVEETEEETEVEEESLKESVDNKKELNEEPRYDLRPEYDARQSFYNKAYVDDEGSEKTLYSYHTKVAEIKNGKPILYPKWDYSQTTLRHVKEFLRQNGFKAESQKQIARDYRVVDESLKEDTQAADVVDKYQEWVDYDMKKYHKISDTTKDKLNKAGFEVVKDDHGDYEVIAKDKKELGEGKLNELFGFGKKKKKADSNQSSGSRVDQIKDGTGLDYQTAMKYAFLYAQSNMGNKKANDYINNKASAQEIIDCANKYKSEQDRFGRYAAAANKEAEKNRKQREEEEKSYNSSTWHNTDSSFQGNGSDLYHRYHDSSESLDATKDGHDDCEVTDKDLKEDIDIHVDRDTDGVSVKSDGIVVDTNDQEVHVYEDENTDVLEPISSETEEKILDANDMTDTDDEEAMSEIEAEVGASDEEGEVSGEEEEVSLEGFEESYFNKLGTIYLRENYGNVRNFETSEVREKNNRLYVEGIINFRSGTQKKTKFIFEGKTISKTGRLKFLGENREIGTGRNAFVLRAKLNDGKVMCESLTYNYNVKDGRNKVNVSGKAKISK